MWDGALGGRREWNGCDHGLAGASMPNPSMTPFSFGKCGTLSIAVDVQKSVDVSHRVSWGVG